MKYDRVHPARSLGKTVYIQHACWVRSRRPSSALAGQNKTKVVKSRACCRGVVGVCSRRRLLARLPLSAVAAGGRWRGYRCLLVVALVDALVVALVAVGGAAVPRRLAVANLSLRFRPGRKIIRTGSEVTSPVFDDMGGCPWLL